MIKKKEKEKCYKYLDLKKLGRFSAMMKKFCLENKDISLREIICCMAEFLIFLETKEGGSSGAELFDKYRAARLVYEKKSETEKRKIIKGDEFQTLYES